jgi:DNA invertase Pin-like site-specific DNA recombinase
MSEKIQPHHLARKAVLYIRQSSAFQVAHNQESQRLQYAMAGRLRELGWQAVEVVDEDLGKSAAGGVARSGFERMVAEVCLGHVGAVAAREVSRFARNSREWQHLIEVCRLVDTLLVDQDTVYAPRLSNDRLLLGLKGSLNEYELDLLRQRSLEARYAKARRGELIVAAPVGYVKTEDQRLEKDSDLRVQEAILLAFRKVVELGTVRQTLLWFQEQGLDLPVRRRLGRRWETVWKRPAYSTLYRLLTHPAYGGAYAYGRSESTSRYEGGMPRKARRHRPKGQALVLIPDAHEGYISWEEFQRIQEMISQNLRGQEQPGAPRRGQGLLAGLLRCRRCGRKLVVHYTGREHDVLRYVCRRGRLDHGEPVCIAFGGLAVDEAIGREVLRVVRPAAMQAAVLATQEASRRHAEVLEALGRDLAAARYAAHRAGKQYDAADPENRLVTEELERRWNQALQRVREIEERTEQQRAAQQKTLPPSLDEFQQLAEDLPCVWHSPGTDARLKKRIVRTLIHEVVADVDPTAGKVLLTIHWKGGIHTEVHLPRRRRGSSRAHTAKEIVEAVCSLVRVCTDDSIAGVLNRNGLRTGRGNRWTRERVATLRSKRRIPRYSPERRAAEGWLTLTKAARVLGISPLTLRRAVERGELRADHPLADGPWIFARAELATDAAVRFVERVRRRTGAPGLPNPRQRTLDLSST